MTNPLTLFDEIPRTNCLHARRTDSSFHSYNTLAWPAFHEIRKTLEQWFENYPQEAKAALRTRFRKDDHNHGSALFELLLHEALLRLGLAPVVIRDPSMPDFAITDRLGNTYYVEATVATRTGPDVDDRLEDHVLDAIDDIARARPTRIAVMAETRGKLNQLPPLRRIQRDVREWLDGIDPATVVTGHFRDNPRREVSHGEWRLTLIAHHVLKRPACRLISGPAKAGFFDDASVLRRKIRGKVNSYDLEHPLIVAITAFSTFVDREDQISSLFGSEAVTVEVDAEGRGLPGYLLRRRDGVWVAESGSRNSRLHGVLFVDGAFPSIAAIAHPYTFINPFIDAKLPAELIQLGNARVQDEQFVYEQGQRLGRILGLPEDWPGPAGMPSDSPLSIGSDGEGARG